MAQPTAVGSWRDGPLEEALEHVGLPAWAVDASDRVVWQNGRARDLFGEHLGQPALAKVAPEEQEAAISKRARIISGETRAANFETTVVLRSGERARVELHTSALSEGGRVLGVFGLATPPGAIEDTPMIKSGSLTPRQVEVLRLLAAGKSTRQIADELHVSAATVRNHVAAILARLGVSSRIGAIIESRRRGLT